MVFGVVRTKSGVVLFETRETETGLARDSTGAPLRANEPALGLIRDLRSRVDGPGPDRMSVVWGFLCLRISRLADEAEYEVSSRNIESYRCL